MNTSSFRVADDEFRQDAVVESTPVIIHKLSDPIYRMYSVSNLIGFTGAT